MRCNNNGQVALWEIALTLCVVAGLYLWYMTHKPSESNTFKDKSQLKQYTETHSGIRLFDFSCVPRSMMDEWGKNANINKAHS